jgi:hypothetical protein
MSEYHKIETLFVRDEKTHKVTGVIRNPVYSIIKTWQWTEKVDGTNIRCIWKDKTLTFGGKTDNAQVHADLIKWLYENVSVEKMNAIFPDIDAVIYGEGYGAGIQKGGYYSPTKKLIIFDVLVGGKWWLNDENVRDVAAKLGIESVPSFGEMTLDDATALVRNGIKSKINPEANAEGLVGRPCEALFDKKGARLIVKLKTKDF